MMPKKIITATTGCLRLLAGLVFSLTAMAETFHQDIEVAIANEQQLRTGFCNRSNMCSIIGIDFLGLPAGQLPNDNLTGKPIYVTRFLSLSGKIGINSPGFFAAPGDLSPAEPVRYQISGHLAYWDPALNRWTLAQEGTKIRLFGGLDIQPDTSCGLVICPPKVVDDGSSLFSRQGTDGAESLIIGDTKTDGSLHTHLDWFLESGGLPGGPAGAYMVEMRIFSEQHPVLSDFFYVLLNHDLPEDQFQQAIATRVLQKSIDTDRSDRLFTWAEANHATIFPHTSASFVALGYYARCYNNGVCVGIKDDHVFATGGMFGNGIVEIGGLTTFLDNVGL